MKIRNGPIIPGVCMGNIKLGITKEELLKIIGKDYQIRHLEIGEILEIENARFWISNDEKVDQIGIGGNFKGKYRGIIGIGSTLRDVKKFVGDYVEVYDTYELEEEKGICFELEDIEDWDELKAPIEYIYVFRVNTE